MNSSKSNSSNFANDSKLASFKKWLLPLRSHRSLSSGSSGNLEKRDRLRTALRIESLENRRLMVGDITGTVFDDLNRNGVDDPSENGLSGWTVFIDTNGNGVLNSGEPSTTTDVKGRYGFFGLPAGSTTVYEVLQDGYTPTPGFTDHQTVNVRDGKEARIKFPNVTTPIVNGSIVGTVFNDTNENGLKDSGEDSLVGWTMFIDSNGDGSLTAGEPTSLTDAEGDYLFAEVLAGPATVFEIPQGGYQPTVPGLFPTQGGTDHHLVNVVAGNSTKSDFANTIPQIGTIQGTVWEDFNGDGIRGATESPQSGRTVFVDVNGNGLIDSGEPSRVSDASGAYSFVDIHTGTYRITEIQSPGYRSAEGRSDTVFSTVFRGGVSVADFYNLIPTPGSIHGVVWNDLDGNGLLGGTETGVSGWQVYVDLNADGVLDGADISTTTGPDGAYALSNVPYGTSTLRQVVPSDWIATNPVTGALSVRVLSGEARTGIQLGSRERIGDIEGTVWNDANGDRARGVSEAGLEGWTVYLDLDGDGAQDAAEPTSLTDGVGGYRFSRVPVGTYRVNEVVQSGWIASIGKPTSVTTTVTIGGVSVVDYFNLVPVDGSISGQVWSDIDSNGVRSATEPGLEGWQVYVDLNSNGSFDTSEPTATTDVSGVYTIAGVAYGNHLVREVVQVGYRATAPVGATRSVFLLNGENQTNLTFGNFELNEFVISGVAFHDANANRTRDPGELGISGIQVYLDTNNNGELDLGEPTTVTSIDQYFTPTINEAGTYTFARLTRGTYSVREIVPAELSATSEAARSFVTTIGPNNVTDGNFANTYRANEIHGVVFDDTNSNRSRDPWEHGRSGVSVYIDIDRDEVYDPTEPMSVTGDDGSYAFVGLTPGAYIVREHSGSSDPHTYPTTGGGTLWPAGTNHAPIGAVSPGLISTSLAEGQSYAQSVSLTLNFSNMVDVFLLFDDTGSFTSNSPIVRDAFPTIISSLEASLPGMDLGFGVGRLEEYGSFAMEFATGRPFTLNQPIISSTVPGFSTSIQAALDRMAPGYGGDTPETDIEALFQLVTGLGFDGNNNGSTTESGPAGLASTQLTPGNSGDVPGFASFTPDLANNVLPASGSVGGGGFRPGALPIILTATDTGFAYQPKGESVITGTGGLTVPLSDLTQMSRPTTPFSSGAGIQETVTGLNALGALVIGLGTNPEPTVDPRQGLEALAKLTGAVNQSTATIANGTGDPIAPGDPFYFQIGTGFGGTVADGVTNAIQNAVTSVAMDITIRASDPRVHIINHTGTLTGMTTGQTATFDIEFVGDGRPHRFDLQFVRSGTNVVVGSIPVELGTPVTGNNYQYDELYEGEIHRSSDFGHYVANAAPSFAKGSDVVVVEDADNQSIAGWATNIDPGAPTEAGQLLDFQVINDNPALFAVQPTISPDGTLVFTPAANASGAATLTVRLHDNGGTGLGGIDTSVPQSMVIQVTPVNDAPVASNDAFAMTEGTTLVATAPGVLSNDSDVEADPLSAVMVNLPTNGSVHLLANGSFDYTPNAGFSGEDSFTYQVTDGSSSSGQATVLITVTAINHAPQSSDDHYSASEDQALTIDLPGVLANDIDPDGDTIQAILVVAPLHGTANLNANGDFVYTPAANFNGSDSFSYKSNDGALDSNVATVFIDVQAVNDAPVANNDSFSTNEDVVLQAALPGVLGNDVDVEGNTLSATLVTGSSHGSVVLNSDGTFTYTPDFHYHGPDSFTYRSNDGTADSNIATVAITVNSVNSIPVANGDNYSTNEDTRLTIAAPGVIGNDVDEDGEALQASLVTGPAHGTLSLGATGGFVYTPAANFSGSDSFTYRVSDGIANSNTATVTIVINAVNDAPIAVNDSYTTAKDTSLTIPAIGVLNNDTDVESNVLTSILVDLPAHGSVLLNSNGSFTYTPVAGYVGADSFTYRATDGVALSGLATVALTVTPPGTKFFVVDADRKATFQYAADGGSISNQNLDQRDSKPRGIASNKLGTIQWVVDLGGNVFVYNNTGNLLGQWTPQGVGKPEGITVWENDIWIVDPTSDRVFKFAGGANLRTGRVNATSSFSLNSGNLNATDIVSDGAHLWVLNDTLGSDKVFRYTAGGALEGSWSISTSSPSPTGITLDPNNVNHMWIVDASTDRVYQYDAATSRLTGAQEPSIVFPLATTNTSPQGIADPLPTTLPPVSPSGSDFSAPASNSLGASHGVSDSVEKSLAYLVAEPIRQSKSPYHIDDDRVLRDVVSEFELIERSHVADWAIGARQAMDSGARNDRLAHPSVDKRKASGGARLNQKESVDSVFAQIGAWVD